MPKSTAQIQRDRRAREKEWLQAHGITSWERLHTLLMRDGIKVLADDEVVTVNIRILKMRDFYPSKYDLKNPEREVIAIDLDN